MQVGIIGLPTSGKTTLFNILTGAKAATSRYGGEKKDANVGVARVPDERLDKLSELHNPKKITPATIEFVDVAGLVPGEAKGTGFPPQLIAALRQVDALLHVVRAFEDDELLHPSGDINPQRDSDDLALELSFADLVIIEKRIEKLEADVKKRSGLEKEAALRDLELMQKCKTALDNETALRDVEFTLDEMRAMRGYTFLSQKPLLIALNIGEDQIENPPQLNEPSVALSARVEADIAELPEEERAEFLEALGLSEPARNRLIRFAYDSLGLQSFFTVGTDECRAWTIKKGDSAVTAASKIHSDLARGFIRAEVIPYEKVVELGGWDKAKGSFMRLEGKEYIVQDGECVHFRSNV